MALRDSVEKEVFQDLMAYQVDTVLEEPRESRARWVLLDPLSMFHTTFQEKVQEVNQAFRVLLDYTENQESREIVGCLVFLDSLMEMRISQVYLEKWDQKVKKVN